MQTINDCKQWYKKSTRFRFIIWCNMMWRLAVKHHPERRARATLGYRKNNNCRSCWGATRDKHADSVGNARNHTTYEHYRCLQNKRPLLTRALLRVCSSPLAFHLRPGPSWSATACKMNARSRHETPRDEIPARARGMYLGMCMALSCTHDGRLFCKHL